MKGWIRVDFNNYPYKWSDNKAVWLYHPEYDIEFKRINSEDSFSIGDWVSYATHYMVAEIPEPPEQP